MMAKRKKAKKGWSCSFKAYGIATVRVRERSGDGILCLEIREKGKPAKWETLGHKDRARGIEEARLRQAQLVAGLGKCHDATSGPTLGVVLDGYHARLRERGAIGDVRPTFVADAAVRADYWKAVLGAHTDPATITHDDIERVNGKRKAGLLDAHGHPVPKVNARPVSDTSVAADLALLRAACRWAVHKKRLLKVNPLDGFELPEEKNPRRAFATADRFEATLAVADKVFMELRGPGYKAKVTSYLPDLLVIAYGTGRRIGAILGLRYEDLRLTATEDEPYGAINWPAETDKMGMEWRAPMSERVRGAADRILVDREVGLRARWKASPYLFPSVKDPTRPMERTLASLWLREAERLANLPKLDGTTWHAYRRGWATARKSYPLADVAKAGGWKDTATLRTAYTQADRATVRKVVLEPQELRD